MGKKNQKLKKKKSGFLDMFVSRADEENLDLIDDGPDNGSFDDTYLFDSQNPEEEDISYTDDFYPEEEQPPSKGQKKHYQDIELFSEEEDLENLNKMTWSDGAPVLEDIPMEPAYDFHDDNSTPEYDEYVGLPEEMDLQDENGNRVSRPSGRTRLFRPSTSLSDDEQYGNEFLPDEEIDPYNENRNPSDIFQDESYEYNPEDEYYDDYYDENTPIPERKTSGKTRFYGNSAVRVSVAETETSRAVHAAARKNREAEAEKQHEKYIKKQTRKQKIREFFKTSALTVTFIVFAVVAFLIAAYFTFQLSDIIVTGNDQYSADYIIELSGLQYGQNVFFMDLDKAKSNITADPYLQVNEITYIFPSRVHIDVEERKEVAGIIGLDYNIIIDKNGYVLSMSGGTDLSNLLQVTGISVAGFKLGERIGEGSDFSTSTLISIIEKLDEYGLTGKIKSIDLTTPLSITMYTDAGFKIFLGQPTDLDTKFSSLSALLPRFEASGITTGTLYLSAKGGTVYSPPGASNLMITGNVEDPTEDGEEATTEEIGEETVLIDPETGEQITITVTPTPLPATPTPVPIQPGGGDDFQG